MKIPKNGMKNAEKTYIVAIVCLKKVSICML